MSDLFDTPLADSDPDEAAAIKALQRQAERRAVRPVHYVELTASLPHLVLMAAVAEEQGKASGSTKLRGLGVPLPFTDHDGTQTMVHG